MHRGYVKLWRKVFDSGIGREHTTFVVWVWLLCNVTRKPLNYIVRGQMIRLEPGEIITGRKVIAANLYTTERAVRTALDHLQTWGNVAIRATKRFSIIKVVNWELYQETGILSGQQEVQETTKKRPRGDQEATTKQECKEVKNEKKKDISYPPDFELFWSNYPRKAKKDDALKAWKQRNGSRPPVEVLNAKVNEFKQTSKWQEDNGAFIPYPATWLRGGCWNDEVKADVKPLRAPTWEDYDEHAKP